MLYWKNSADLSMLPSEFHVYLDMYLSVRHPLNRDLKLIFILFQEKTAVDLEEDLSQEE